MKKILAVRARPPRRWVARKPGSAFACAPYFAQLTGTVWATALPPWTREATVQGHDNDVVKDGANVVSERPSRTPRPTRGWAPCWTQERRTPAHHDVQRLNAASSAPAGLEDRFGHARQRKCRYTPSAVHRQRHACGGRSCTSATGSSNLTLPEGCAYISPASTPRNSGPGPLRSSSGKQSVR